MYIGRTIESLLGKVATQFPVMLVVGPRQVGKTTVLHHARRKEMTYVTLEDPTTVFLAKEQPSLFLNRQLARPLAEGITA